MREKREIKVEKNNGMLDGERLSHPAFEIVSFSRIRGGNTILFGSSIKHDDRVRLRVTHAITDRELSKDWNHAEGTICEVEMS